MAMKYQKGTVYPRGRKVKMWYGKYTVYLRNEEGKEVGKRRNVPLCPKAGTPKWKAEEMLHALILQETGVPAKTSPGVIPDETVTFQWFVARALFADAAGHMEPCLPENQHFRDQALPGGAFRANSAEPTGRV